MNDLTQYSGDKSLDQYHSEPLRDRRLSPIQQVALRLFLEGTIHQETPNSVDLLQYYAGLATTTPHRGLSLAMDRFVQISDPYAFQALSGGKEFNWRIDGDYGYAGDIVDLGEPLPVGHDGLWVYNVGVIPFPGSPESVWLDPEGNPVGSDYELVIPEHIHFDPLLLTHMDPAVHSRLLVLQHSICDRILQIARPLVGVDIANWSDGYRIWNYSGPLSQLDNTTPPFGSLPGGHIFVTDGRGRDIGYEQMPLRAHAPVTENMNVLTKRVRRMVKDYLTKSETTEQYAPAKGISGFLGRMEWQTETTPSRMDGLLTHCQGLKLDFEEMGIDRITASAAAYSWYIGMMCAARKAGINI